MLFRHFMGSPTFLFYISAALLEGLQSLMTGTRARMNIYIPKQTGSGKEWRSPPGVSLGRLPGATPGRHLCDPALPHGSKGRGRGGLFFGGGVVVSWGPGVPCVSSSFCGVVLELKV